MKRRSVVLVFSVVLLACASTASAQREDDILRPVPFRFHVGPLIGLGYNASYGEFQTLCQCEYSAGYGFGPIIGGFIDYPVSRDLSVYVVGGTQSLNASYDKAQQRYEYVEQMGQFRAIDFELETDLTLYTFGVGTYVKWDTPVSGLYLAAGPEFGFVLYSNIEETERIVSPGYTYIPSGERESVFMDGGLSEYYDANTFRMAVAGKIGYIIPILDRLAIAPEFTVAVPFTSVTAEYGTWKILPYQFTIAARFGI
ncbi:MAG: hypothetical protein M5R41_02190 [Bacteroidia bacterium]|nr:hypothetical protein [Bacteroidia bacterium]